MHRRLLLAAVTASAVLAALPLAAASAATTDVLTTIKLGGPNVKVGDTLKASLATGTKATFKSSAGAVICSKSTVTDKVTANPAKPGTATESLTAQTLATCTTNIGGATSVKSVKVLKLPYKVTVSDSSGFPVTVFKLVTQLTLNTGIGPVTCTYGAAAIHGNASNKGSTQKFISQLFKLVSGSTACPSSGGFSATFGPYKDTSMTGSPAVFIN